MQVVCFRGLRAWEQHDWTSDTQALAHWMSTRKLLGNLFELQDLGAQDLKGLLDLVTALVVAGFIVSPSRFLRRPFRTN